MGIKVFDSNHARTKWRDVLDLAFTRASDVVIERYGKPVVAMIAYEDYVALQDELDNLRAARYAAAVYEEWKQDPSIARPYAEFRAELVSGGTSNEPESTPLDDTR